MKKILISILFIFNLSAKTVYRCYSPFNVPDLTNFDNINECMRLCGGSNKCYPVNLTDLQLEEEARD